MQSRVPHYQDRPRPSKTENLLGCRSNQWTLARQPSTISPSQNAVVHPDPYRVRPIHSPAVFLLVLAALCVCPARHSPPHSPVFLPVTTSLRYSQPRSRLFLLPVCHGLRPCPPHVDRKTPSNRQQRHPSVCLSVCSQPSPHSDTHSPCVLRPAALCCFAVLCCAALRCDDLTALGRSLIAGICPPASRVAKPPPSPLSGSDFPRTNTTSSRRPRQISSRSHSYPSIAVRLRLGAFLPRFSARAH